MRDCQRITELLSSYLDRDLPPDTCAAIAAHLDECSHCGAEADKLRQTVNMCRQYRHQALPSPLREEKRAELRDVLERTLAEIKQDGER